MNLLPPAGLQRQLAVQAAVGAVGWGVYLTGSVVFFKLYTGLSAIQIALGFSIAGFVGLVTAIPLGHLADRTGGKRAWLIGAGVGVVTFAVYPLVRGFWPFVVVVAFQAIYQGLTSAGRSVYTAAVLAREDRVRGLAYVRSYSNVGFTVGAGVGAAAIAIDSRPALVILVLANALGVAVGMVLVARLPPGGRIDIPRQNGRGLLRDHAFAGLAAILALVALNGVVFGEVMPLWAVTETDMPRPMLGGLVALNTVLAVLLQVPASKGADSLAGAARLTRWAALATGAACLVFELSGRTGGLATIVVLLVGVVLLTGGELWAAAAQWFFVTDVPPPDQRGVYMGAVDTLNSAGRMVGPASLTFLAIRTGGWGWWVIAALFVLVALAVDPVVDRVHRQVDHQPPTPASTRSTGTGRPR